MSLIYDSLIPSQYLKIEILSFRNQEPIYFSKMCCTLCECDRSSHRRCSIKKLFLKISQNSQENTCRSLFFNKVRGLSSENLFYRTPLGDYFLSKVVNLIEDVRIYFCAGTCGFQTFIEKGNKTHHHSWRSRSIDSKQFDEQIYGGGIDRQTD